MLGQLVVTPKVVASKISNIKDNESPGVDGIAPKINNMKDNESPGVDGIAPKILKETAEQIRFKKQVRKLSTSQFNISNFQSIRKYN